MEPEASKELEKVPAHVAAWRKWHEMSVEKKAIPLWHCWCQGSWSQFRALMRKTKDHQDSRCQIDIVSEVCPGVACFNAFNKRKIHFSEYGKDAEMIGFFRVRRNVPGRRVFRLVDSLLKHNVDVIHLSSCMLMEKSYSKCPHLEDIKQMITRKGVKIVEGTHH